MVTAEASGTRAIPKSTILTRPELSGPDSCRSCQDLREAMIRGARFRNLLVHNSERIDPSVVGNHSRSDCFHNLGGCRFRSGSAEPTRTLGDTIRPMEEGRPPQQFEAWLEEFEAARKRPLSVRIRYAFIKTYRPVLDDEPFRAFDTMEDYRRWCEAALPDWLGYGRV